MIILGLLYIKKEDHMRGRLSKCTVIVINIIVIIIFIVGLYYNIYAKNLLLGIICQCISLLYTIIFGLISLLPNTTTTLDMPTPYFTDRKDVINDVVKRLYEIMYKHNQEQIISIKCEDENGIGKTELLLKLKQILNNSSIAKKYMHPQTYSMYKKLRHKLGLIHFISYSDDHTISFINQLPYVFFKHNIILIDDLPTLNCNPFQKKFIIICCQPDKVESVAQIKLQKFSAEDISAMYKTIYNKEIDPLFLKRVLDYTHGNITQVSRIFKSQDSCELFQKNSYTVYQLYYHINNGEYTHAQKLLEKLQRFQHPDSLQDENYQYRLKFIEYDLLHYNNMYIKSLEGYNILLTLNLTDHVRYYEICERLCHINGHMGKFDDALGYAENLPEHQRRKSKLVLHLLNYAMKMNETDLLNAKKYFYEMDELQDLYVTSKKDSYHTYQAVLLLYDFKYDSAHNAIDKAIDCYERIGSKFLTNCYFIKAEIYRHEGKHNNACEYYQKCLNIYRLNEDFDVYSLVVTLLIYEVQINKAKHNFSQDYSLEFIKKTCDKLNMNYNRHIAMSLDMLIKYKKTYSNKKKEYKKIQSYFEQCVFFIP